MMTGIQPQKKKSAMKSLQEKRTELIRDYLEGRAEDFLVRHAALIDGYFWESFTRSDVGPLMDIARNPYAIIALGGYGRMEQCVHSDVDILFLFEKDVPPAAEALIQEIIYPLWDIGLEVGHATRSVGECLSLASRDLEVLTAVLDARFVCGMSPLFMTLMEKLRARFVTSHPKKIMGWLVEGNRKRHEQFGDSTHLLEPNIKLGQGGLRDYHTMLWLGRVRFGLKEPRDLEYNGYLSWEEFHNLKKALAFIWKVRNHLHYLTGRKCDQLYFEHQIQLAETLGFTAGEGMTAVERFLGALHLEMDFIKQHLLMLLDEAGHDQKLGLKRRYRKTTRIAGLVVHRGMLGFDDIKSVLKNPELLVAVFQESGSKKLPLSAEAKRIVREMGYLVDEALCNRRVVLKMFERTLAIPPFAYHPLNEMQATGLMSQLIPEFDAIISRIQYNKYHLYPVAKHSLRTVQTAAGFALVPKEKSLPHAVLYHETFGEIKNKRLLLWGALLHDIGKGVPGDDHSKEGAVLARKILARFGMRSDYMETVVFLVQEHLFLIKAATRRDINDEETVTACAMKIRDPERLRMLFLLTVADSVSTGPKAWSEWTATLLTSLYFKVLKMLEKGTLAEEDAIERIEEKQKRILENVTEAERPVMEALLEGMPPAYLLELSVADIRAHMRLSLHRKGAPFAWQVERCQGADLRRVLIHADDKPGFFSRAAGAFTLNRIDILDARIYGWKDGAAANLFILKPPPDQIFEEEIWEKTRKDLEDLLTGKIEMGAIVAKAPLAPSGKGMVLEPPLIRIDNESSSFYTIVEVHSYDFPGLLFRLTSALFRCRLDVKSAKIATKVDQVVDVFYVRDFDGEKMDSPEQEALIRQTVRNVLPEA
ncbi:[protein-PII] uridylyltransferase [Desulfobotulus sp. H1]|uniref:Bifunctional uridylyltransferase/uridylyl-removing enzyme n=1 Tax=Desulfobotulus pelophilus TaxID=2823377 RepID=A0ABT3N8X2_9BACT|nr:[protein-PII] uridylyltransferase [Desulfobotulus pelophilus]MCW7753911.1 [protein-PII] uridylyltransferase [Desulfobotulus pelophilus]